MEECDILSLGYWFDRVLHLLYFDDAVTEARISKLLGNDLSPCRSQAWVETPYGTARFPLQMHLGSLDKDTVIRCMRDLAEVTFTPGNIAPSNFEEMLLQTFGRGICEVFMFPYNRKFWKRPLNTLAPSGFQWNIAHPNLERVLRGALNPNSEFQPYNSKGWYPRPVGRGHWRYYSDETLIFTRLIYTHEFDPYSAPDNGWGLLAEITEPSENPVGDPREILSRVRTDIYRVGALPEGCEVIDEHLLLIDPAYVVFTVINQKVIEQVRTFLTNSGIIPMGRYGRWEYSSMAQVMRDGFSWGEEVVSRKLNQYL